MGVKNSKFYIKNNVYNNIKQENFFYIETNFKIVKEINNLAYWNIEEINKLFSQMMKLNYNLNLNFIYFNKLFYNLNSDMKCIFHLFQDKDGYVYFFELISAIVLLSYLNFEEKLIAMFKIFNCYKDLKVENINFFNLYQSLIKAYYIITGFKNTNNDLIEKNFNYVI